MPTRLTTRVKAGGCASKLSPKILDCVLVRIPRASGPQLLAGLDTADDAGVYRISDDLALAQTLGFFTPIVDDPFALGAIAAVSSAAVFTTRFPAARCIGRVEDRGVRPIQVP